MRILQRDNRCCRSCTGSKCVITIVRACVKTWLYGVVVCLAVVSGIFADQWQRPRLTSGWEDGGIEQLRSFSFGVYISEFMASNGATIADGSGNYSDWIEIYNAQDIPVDLSGWYLTDAWGRLRKWRFPEGTVIDAWEYLLVFASGRTEEEYPYFDPEGYLHTNFRLAADGEDVLLVTRDGVTIAHGYHDYPSQVRDVSYGLPQSATDLVSGGMPAAYLVPEVIHQDEAWTAVDYDDMAWDRGYMGLGFRSEGPLASELLARWVSDHGHGDLVLDAGGNGYHGVLSGSLVPQWIQGPAAGIGQAISFPGHTGSNVRMGYIDLNLDGAFTMACWVKAPMQALGHFRVILAKGPKEAGHFELYLNGQTGGGRTNGGAAMYVPELGDFWSGYVVPDGHWHHLAWMYDGNQVRFHANGVVVKVFAAHGRVTARTERLTVGSLVDGSLPFLGDISDIRIYNRALSDATITALVKNDHEDIATNLRDQMLHSNSTLWMRVPFSIADPHSCDRLILTMRYLDGFIAYLNGVRIAEDNAPAIPAWDSSASHESLEQAEVVVSEFDVSAHTGVLLPGTNILAVHGLNDDASDGDFLLFARLKAGRRAIHDLSDARYFDEPTPGRENGAGLGGLAGAPQFSRNAGAFAIPFHLTLSVSSPHARIHYTLDSSEPTEFSPRYRDPIAINHSMEVRARIYEPDMVPGPVISHMYFALAEDICDFSSNLPIVIVDTRGRVIPESHSGTYAETHSLFFDVDGAGRSSFGCAVDFVGRMGVRIRGRSSAAFPKKQYKIELWDDNNRSHDNSLLGLPPESDWVLWAPYSDKSLIRNYLAYRWWGQLGHYSVRTRFCEVFLNENGANRISYAQHYVGVYLLVEHIKIGQERVDIARLSPEDNAEPHITGGYIIEMGNANPGGWNSNISGQTVEFDYWRPRENKLTSEQQTWVQDYIRRFETALYGPEFCDPVSGYAWYTDVGSQVDYEIMREFTRNFDGGSTFMHIDRGGQLAMGPLWDYNMAIGNVNYAHDDIPGYHTTGWNNSYMAPGVNGWCPWWRRFQQDPAYRRKFAARWHELRRGPLSDVSITADIDSVVALLNEASLRNFQRWNILGQYIWANPPGWESRTTYLSEVDWLRRWLLDRSTWIDDQLGE